MTIDELVVALKLDPSNFTAGQKAALEDFRKFQEEMDKRLKNVERAQKRTAQGTVEMTQAAQGLFTALAGAGMVQYARTTMDAAAATGRMATNIGVATAEASAFGRMIERNGGNAAAANANLKGLADTMQRMNQFGQVSQDFLMGLSTVGGGQNDDPITLFLKLARYADTHSAQQVNAVGAKLGFDQQAIDKAIQGSAKAMADYKRAFDGALSPEQTKKLTEMQDAWVGLGQAVTSVGTEVLTQAAPWITRVQRALTEWISNNKEVAVSITGILTAITALGMLKPVGWIARLLGFGGVATAAGMASRLPGMVLKGGGIGGMALMAAGAMKYDKQNGNHLRDAIRDALGIKGDDEDGDAKFGDIRDEKGRINADGERFIRMAAKRLGLDPDVTVRNLKTEGWNAFQSSVIRRDGTRETSYGAAQAYVSPGGRAKGMGDQYKAATGRDPSDPENEKDLIIWQLNQIKQKGNWDDLHGVRNNRYSSTEGINVGSVVVQLPNVKDAQAFADELPGAIKTQTQIARSIANNANTGQRP